MRLVPGAHDIAPLGGGAVAVVVHGAEGHMGAEFVRPKGRRDTLEYGGDDDRAPDEGPHPRSRTPAVRGEREPEADVQHLREDPEWRVPHLPDELAYTVAVHLQQDEDEGIPYNVLADVSRWARQNDVRNRFGLDPHDYTLLALLAGTRTTPSANFSVPVGPIHANKTDRKAITALANAVFSIIGVGVAGWYASTASGWDNEVVRPCGNSPSSRI